MKTTKISLIILGSVSGTALLGLAALVRAQQPVPANLAAGFNSIRDTLRANLTFFASDALQGRMSLQNGDPVAIQWIASEFAKAGLQPAAISQGFLNLPNSLLSQHKMT